MGNKAIELPDELRAALVEIEIGFEALEAPTVELSAKLGQLHTEAAAGADPLSSETQRLQAEQARLDERRQDLREDRRSLCLDLVEWLRGEGVPRSEMVSITEAALKRARFGEGFAAEIARRVSEA